jgi:hypothetical protein
VNGGVSDKVLMAFRGPGKRLFGYTIPMSMRFWIATLALQTSLALAVEPVAGHTESAEVQHTVSCARAAVTGYQKIQRLAAETMTFIEGNKSGKWKVLKNFVLSDLKRLAVPAFENQEHLPTKITYYKERSGYVTNFESTFAFAKSRWALNQSEAEALCVSDQRVEYTVPAFTGDSSEPKRKISGVIRLSMDLDVMSFEIRQTLEEHIFDKSGDAGHIKVAAKLREMLEVITSLKQDTRRPTPDTLATETVKPKL